MVDAMRSNPQDPISVAAQIAGHYSRTGLDGDALVAVFNNSFAIAEKVVADSGTLSMQEAMNRVEEIRTGKKGAKFIPRSEPQSITARSLPEVADSLIEALKAIHTDDSYIDDPHIVDDPMANIDVHATQWVNLSGYTIKCGDRVQAAPFAGYGTPWSGIVRELFDADVGTNSESYNYNIMVVIERLDGKGMDIRGIDDLTPID